MYCYIIWYNILHYKKCCEGARGGAFGGVRDLLLSLHAISTVSIIISIIMINSSSSSSSSSIIIIIIITSLTHATSVCTSSAPTDESSRWSCYIILHGIILPTVYNISLSLSLSPYIYIYIERERDTHR